MPPLRLDDEEAVAIAIGLPAGTRSVPASRSTAFCAKYTVPPAGVASGSACSCSPVRLPNPSPAGESVGAAVSPR